MNKEIKLVGSTLTTVTTQKVQKMFIPVRFRVDIWAESEDPEYETESGWNSLKIVGNDNEMSSFFDDSKYNSQPYILRELLQTASRRNENLMTTTEEVDMECMVDMETKQIFWIEKKDQFKLKPYELYHEITKYVPSECLEYAINENFVLA